VDGQPRTINQLEKVLYDYVEYPKSFVHVFATRHERVIRAIKRDAGNQAKLKLSMDRMDGDIPVIYEIDTLLRCAGEDVEIVNTGAADFSMASAVGSLLNAWSRNTGYLKAA
jgi:hypothetical protein